MQLISRDTNDLGGFVISKLILKYRRNRLTFLAWLRFYQGLFLSSMLNFLRMFQKKSEQPHLAASVHLEPLLGRGFRSRRNGESASGRGGAVPLREGKPVLD